MLQDTTETLSNNEPKPGYEYALYTDLEPLVVYSQDNKVKVAVMTGVTTPKGSAPFDPPSAIKVRKQGVRDGVMGYNAKGSLPSVPLVPILCFVEESLVDAMLLNPAALAMGAAALKAAEAGPSINPLVDTLVEEYEESAPIEGTFFLPVGDGTVATLTEPVESCSTPEFTGCLTYNESTPPSIEDDTFVTLTEPLPPVSGSISVGDGDKFFTPDTAIYTNSSVCESLVFTTPSALELDPGIVQGGGLLDYDPEVHVIPT